MDDIFGATIAAIRELSPNLKFVISAKSDDVAQVDWDTFKVDEGQTAVVPSRAEIEQKRTELLNAVPLRKLREARNIKLLETDWIVTKSIETGQPISQQWLTYRQALRDITENYTSLNDVIWPNKPI